TGEGYIDKGSLAGIVEQPVLAYTGDENVREAVVVIVADSHAHAVHLNVESGAGSNVGEGSVSVVVIQPQRGVPLLVAGPIHSVDEENVLPAVAVVIEEGTAGTHGFGKKFSSKGAAVMLELEAGARGYVHEAKAGGRPGTALQAEGARGEQLGCACKPRHVAQKRSAIHGTFTSPARMA